MEIMEHPQTSPTEPNSPDPPDLLFSLPAELLLPIFSFVGAENFRQDVRRLAVCREWYAYARPILLGELQLYSADLFPMLRAMDNSETRAAVQQFTKHIEMETNMNWDFPEGLARQSLGELASKVQAFAALRTLVIRPGDGRYVLPTETFCSFASLQQLTSLELDLKGIEFEETYPHLCGSLSRLIPTLKRLRCRLPDVCDKLLDGPPGGLEELIIIISGEDGFHLYSHSCLSSVIRIGELRAALESRLLQFAASMRSPKVARLIYSQTIHPLTLSPGTTYCAYEDNEIFAFDAIANRHLFLGIPCDMELSPWDVEGTLKREGWKPRED